MSGDSLQQNIEKIQNTQNNIKIFTAVPMGILLLLYFFSYAPLIDHGYTSLLIVEIVTSILFVLAFIFLNSWTFRVVKMIYKNRSPYREIMQQLTPANIIKPAEQLRKEIQLP
ncbi:MAG: hypothetical protein AMJ53_01795 [Gammaproteobacteria bacterium SG8_11]|nr:MAG: hypothetical protein AMJ53_01795 [Gammaproteobacteria bacterium SG8_11]